jgi:bacterioferritin (cytochrome b1)
VVSAAPGTEDPSRRTLLKVCGPGFVVGASLLLAGCGQHKRSTLRAAPTPLRELDVGILNQLLDLELHTIAAYTAGIPLLGKPQQAIAQQFLGQELAHADELGGLIRLAGSKPLKAKPSYDLGHPRTHRDVLRLLHALERAQVAAYLAAIPRVYLGSVRAALAAVVANDAQHIFMLRPALGLEPMPGALVTGAE